jgi:hypothetical protein
MVFPNAAAQALLVSRVREPINSQKIDQSRSGFDQNATLGWRFV